ncbi:hypothetical protein LI951_07080 [Enterococcus sp. BWT-B8]|uniref:hypothetical protein n=1 Tax=unclassified Enterococcus TaxID=2608891 RepID=UPI001E441A68|nr:MULTISPECIES: hypothetical protein [unclassified Enterococcus]MCB5951823.1 hypothetical protein [Enterococcus sp. BWT-B8]MCB5954023.1 hypothetical protein [Enterococcus sp. CWB-B31]
MKKIGLFLLAVVTVLSFAGCGSSEDGAAVSTKQSTEDKTANETKKMEAMQKDLEDKGVEFSLSSSYGYLYFNREKSLDYDYFEMRFVFNNDTDEVYEVELVQKGNIDGKEKDTQYYDISSGRIVESSVISDSDISNVAEVLESIDYSDKELLEFAKWYYENNK